MSKKKRLIISKLSIFLLGLTVLISLMGLLFIFESSTGESYQLVGHPYHFVEKQSVWLLMSAFLFFIALLPPLKFYKKISPLFFLFALLSMLLVFVPGIGVELNGAKRWFSLLNITLVQPVEILKLSLLLFFASWMSRHQKILPFLFLTLLPSILVLIQPDLGSTLIILSIAFGMYFVAGGNLLQISSISGVGIFLLALLVLFSPYRRERLTTFLNPELDPLGSGFHIRQITLALGRGGFWGQGLGQSAQKYKYIPEASSDSIMAIVAEEIGFFGVSFIIGTYLLYFLIILKIAGKQKKGSFKQLLVVGILIWFASQTILNLAAIVALVPLTGIPLPFFSYGGSSLVMLVLATALVFKVAASRE